MRLPTAVGKNETHFATSIESLKLPKNNHNAKLFNRRVCNNFREAQPTLKLLHTSLLNNDHYLRARRRNFQPGM